MALDRVSDFAIDQWRSKDHAMIEYKGYHYNIINAKILEGPRGQSSASGKGTAIR